MPTLLGIPLDMNSSFLRGPAGAPAKIREALRSDARNKWTELRVDLGAVRPLDDASGVRLTDSPEQVSEEFAVRFTFLSTWMCSSRPSRPASRIASPAE